MSLIKEIFKDKEEKLKKGFFPFAPPQKAKKGKAFSRALGAPGLSLIAEIKKASPSCSRITEKSVESLASVYDSSAASCISVLTEEKYFKGSTNDILKVKELSSKPVLMKDFIFFKEQIYLAADLGADAVLIIAPLLEKEQVKNLNRAARDCGVEALNEIHGEGDLEKLEGSGAEIIGVNSRNLQTLEIDTSLHSSMFKRISKAKIKVAESGINCASRARLLLKQGYDAVLVGGAILKSPGPVDKIRELCCNDSG
ncbi:MAG: indole-3-glycerol-phosphate synthase [Elusimicrobiota bacterium]